MPNPVMFQQPAGMTTSGNGRYVYPITSTANSFGINPNSKTYASETMAAIARRDWERYKETFMPLEDYLFQYINNPGYRQGVVSDNLQNFNSAFDSAQAGNDRNLQRYGLQLSPDETQSQQRMASLQKGLGQVEAINRTNRVLKDQEYRILGAGTNPTASLTNMGG